MIAENKKWRDKNNWRNKNMRLKWRAKNMHLTQSAREMFTIRDTKQRQTETQKRILLIGEFFESNENQNQFEFWKRAEILNRQLLWIIKWAYHHELVKNPDCSRAYATYLRPTANSITQCSQFNRFNHVSWVCNGGWMNRHKSKIMLNHVTLTRVLTNTSTRTLMSHSNRI